MTSFEGISLILNSLPINCQAQEQNRTVFSLLEMLTLEGSTQTSNLLPWMENVQIKCQEETKQEKSDPVRSLSALDIQKLIECQCCHYPRQNSPSLKNVPTVF